jgi:hypothetical protein
MMMALVLMTASAMAQTREQAFTGDLTAQAPRASFELTLEAGQIVTLETSSRTGLDTMLVLNGPNGRSVAENDDVQPGVLTSRIVYVARAAGRHTAVVSGYGGSRGAFNLDVTYGLDVGLSGEARTLREETVSLDRRRAEARFPVDLAANDIFVASTFALTAGLDTTLTLVDASGNVVGESDDRGDGTLNSQIVYQPPQAGRYEVVASTFGRAGAGDFVISLAIDPNAQAPFNFASIEGVEIARHEGEINDAQPMREFRIDLAAGQTLYAAAEATSGNLDPVLTLNDAEGYPVALNDDRGDGSLNAAFAYTARTAGTFTLELSRYQQSPSSGGFRLVLSSVDSSVVATLQALADNQVALSGPELTIETHDFRVYYTLEGRDASTAEYARLTADALQEVFTMQTQQLGWAAPVRDPDGRYRAYVADALGNMGYTKPVEMVFDNPSTSVRERAAARALLVIDNDFQGMGKKAPPESLMRATATHELGHVVQFGYDAQEGLNWLYESTASWIETVTVGDDQDATEYVETDYAAPNLCWTTRTRGFNYAQWTLLQSLADQYGNAIVVRLWENTVEHDGFETMSRTLADVGTTIPDAILRWRAQNYAADYALAPKFPRAVALAGTISRNGSWSPRGEVQQLGAQYAALRLNGARTFTLRGDANLELVGLGRRDGQVDVVRLGRGGVFDASAYEHAALMVFNRAVPSAPGECRDVDYSVNVTAAAGAAPEPAYRFNAQHFRAPS